MAGEFIRQVLSLHDSAELEQLATAAGFRDASAFADTKALHLPPPTDFLWQYIHSTPLAGMVANTSDHAREALERDVVASWKPFQADDGGTRYDQRVVTVTARK